MVIAGSPSWVHEYVRSSSGSASFAVPERLTVAPSTTLSLAVRVTVTVVSAATSGAVNEVDSAVWFANVVGEGADQ